MQQPEGFKPQRREGRHPGQSDWVRDLCLRVSTVPARPGRPLFAVRRLPHANPQVDRQCFSRNRTSAVPMQTTHGKHPGDAKLIESGGCCRRILGRQGDPWTWDGRVPWGNGSAPLVLLRSAWRCGTGWLRPARRAMQWHAGGPGARRVLVRPTWICSSRPSWDDTSGAYFTAGQGCIQAGFVWPFPARILASGRWMGRWIERWILLWITLWISD